METRLRSFAYNVETKNADINIQEETPRSITDAKDISVITNVVMEDYGERRLRTESANENIKPYGLELVDKGEIKSPASVSEDAVKDHIEISVKTATKSK